MLLNEMFSPLGGPKTDDQGVDWITDLKFFIDNDEAMLRKYIFPAILKHRRCLDSTDTYKLYVKPLVKCLNVYCDRFDVNHKEEKFPKEELLQLAKQIANEQHTHITQGDYNL